MHQEDLEKKTDKQQDTDLSDSSLMHSEVQRKLWMQVYYTVAMNHKRRDGDLKWRLVSLEFLQATSRDV